MIDRSHLGISADSRISESDLAWRYGPSGGPGGQHANTTNSRVELVWNIQDANELSDQHRHRLLSTFGPKLRVTVDETRSQARNRDLALAKLMARVKNALVVKPKRRKTKPSRRANQRRLEEKKRRSQTKSNRRKDYD